MRKGGKKQVPKVGAAPVPVKKPRYFQAPPPFRGGVLAWRFNAVDKEGPFAWTNLRDPHEFKRVIEKLAEFETMSVSQLSEHGCHFVDITALSKRAQQRLMKLKLDDLDALYSLRLTARSRVFCVHRPQYMRVLWYDPEHQVCPSPKKHS